MDPDVGIAVGASAELIRVVGAGDTATALGSGDVPVLATPRLLAWAEAATVAALADRLGPDQTSVGTRVELEHRAPSAVGATVVVTAELIEIEAGLLRFAVAAHDGGREICRGLVARAVVDRERFRAGLTRRSSSAGTRSPDR
jgi:predicted thioesterase